MTFPPRFRWLSFALAALAMTALPHASFAAETIKIVGAGASFPAPL